MLWKTFLLKISFIKLRILFFDFWLMLKKFLAGAMITGYALMGLVWTTSAFNPTEEAPKTSFTQEFAQEVAKPTVDALVNFWEEVVGLFSIAQTHASNPLVGMADGTASGSINAAEDVMASDLGYIIYFVIALSIIWLVVGVIMYWSKKR